MRRGRAPSREPSGSGGPQWDDPNSRLPGTGIPGDGGDSLYRSSSLRRRRDASPVRGTVESVGQEGVGVVPETTQFVFDFRKFFFQSIFSSFIFFET